ncbi:MAG: DUF937 domain-containing protein [Pyrinomonadaceae bacterium]|nr:DUF937 domain-containing protein [Pyrinomonadaceae bacterium]
MFNELLGQLTGANQVNQISQTLGAEPSMVNSAIQMALPTIIGAMANNASNPQVTNAITQDNGGILDNLGGFLGNPTQAANVGGGLLGSLLGNNQGQVASQISQQSGLNMGQTAGLLTMLAPIVLGYLGRQQTNQNLDAGGIGSMLNGYNQQAQQSPMGGMMGAMLDRNNDGSVVDDLASMAMGYFSKR